MSFASIPTTITHLRSGKLRALGVGSLKRNALVPDVPTIDESGLPGYEFSNWIGIVAPAGTPPAIVARLHKELTAIQDTPELKKQFAHEGADDRADELRRIRQVHRVGNRQVGARGQGGGP